MIPGYFKPLSKFYYNAVKQLSPYAYWRMNEKTGTQALDSSGNNFTGTYTNATLDQSALVLNNSQQSSVLYTTANQSYLNFGSNSNLSNFNRTVTFSLWAMFTAIDSSPYCIYIVQEKMDFVFVKQMAVYKFFKTTPLLLELFLVILSSIPYIMLLFKLVPQE